MVDLMDALQLDQPDMMGWSMGGIITLTVAANYPDAVNPVVVRIRLVVALAKVQSLVNSVSMNCLFARIGRVTEQHSTAQCITKWHSTVLSMLQDTNQPA